MFKNKKRLLEVELEQQKAEIRREKAEISREKAELQFIKEQLEDTSPKVDITYVHVFQKYGINYLATLYIEPISGTNWMNQPTKGYHSYLVDIFSNEVLFDQNNINPLHRKETIYANPLHSSESYDITCTPICEVVPELLAYPNKQVPAYVLQQVYYKLNSVNVNSKTLRKEKIIKGD